MHTVKMHEYKIYLMNADGAYNAHSEKLSSISINY